MQKIRKNDIVHVLSGKDRGKTGKVFHVYPQKGRAMVEGINYVKKHVRKNKQDQQGGIVQKEAAIQLSNLALHCKTCNRPAHVGISVLADGSRSRFCKKCKEVI